MRLTLSIIAFIISFALVVAISFCSHFINAITDIVVATKEIWGAMKKEKPYSVIHHKELL